MARPGKRFVKNLIEAHGGIISEMARNCQYGVEMGVSRQTVYNWLDHYQLRGECEAARVGMRMVARDVIYQRLMSEDDDAAFEAARFVSLHLNDAGELLYLSPEVMGMLRDMGIPMADVAAAFEKLVRQKHLESIEEDD